MPNSNSCFRIIKREKDDPHGAEGFFIHELLVDPDGVVRKWKAGISIGAATVESLRDFYELVLMAFSYPVISHKDLAARKVQIRLESATTPANLIHEHSVDPRITKAPVCLTCKLPLCGKMNEEGILTCWLLPDHEGDHAQGVHTWPDSPTLKKWGGSP